MKKNIYSFLLVAFMTACASGENPKEEVSDELKQQTQIIEEATQESDELIQDLESEFKASQSEIDSLLNDI